MCDHPDMDTPLDKLRSDFDDEPGEGEVNAGDRSTPDSHSDEARLAAHQLRDLDTARLARTKLVDLGQTPPKHPIDRPQVPTVAFMHPVADLATTDPHAYTNLSAGPPRELVRKDDVLDLIDWLEHGIDEWRSVAVECQQRNRELREQVALLQAAIGRLQAEDPTSDTAPAPGA